MLERPSLTDAQITQVLSERYRLNIAKITFLPIGYDMQSSVFKVETDTNANYFLKAKTSDFNPICAAIPHFLFTNGLTAVVAPITTTSGGSWTSCAAFTIMLYPFIEGNSGMVQGMTLPLWAKFGQVLRRLHQTELPKILAAQLPREHFQPSAAATMREVNHMLDTLAEVLSEVQHSVAAFWRAQVDKIDRIMQLAEDQGDSLRTSPPPYVLCHADCHTANLLIDTEGQLHVVDWDQPILAPRERDLMFVIGNSIDGVAVGPEAEAAFRLGYGNAQVNAQAVAYYRCEWAIQDLGDFAWRIFLLPDIGEQTLHDAVRGLKSMFEPGNVIELALKSANPPQS